MKQSINKQLILEAVGNQVKAGLMAAAALGTGMAVASHDKDGHAKDQAMADDATRGHYADIDPVTN